MDRQVRISDITMKQNDKNAPGILSFKEKLELCKLLDRTGAAVIEIEGIKNSRVDSLLIKSIASAVKNSAVAVPVELSEESVEAVWAAVCGAREPRLQVVAAVSPMQMEYVFHKKPDAMLKAITETVALCAEKTSNVEFVAEDAARSDEKFLYSAIRAAVEAGAKTVTLCDSAGNLLPDEFCGFVETVCKNVPELGSVTLGVSCVNTLSLADACLIAAVGAGARELKAASYPIKTASVKNIAKILSDRGEAFGVYTSARTVEMNRITGQIESIFAGGKGKAADSGENRENESIVLTKHDDKEAVLKAAQKIGFELSEEDAEAVWEAFTAIAERREQIDSRELDAIIASAAMQVPPTFTLKSYMFTASNLTKAVANVTLVRDEVEMEGVGLGDGPVDAAFLALEQASGCRYELDEFSVRSVTEGRGAMGETVVRLVSNGKLYSGRGLSTDIVGSSIAAYVSALNKIAFEEDQI
ncbi:MAG: hypothetical protein IJS90_01800 [Clostridia bacterium]|nr:hypothetical protein [Clostridia bacterium]